MIVHSLRDNYPRGVIGGYNLLGIIYTYEDDYVRAATSLKEALKIGENYLSKSAQSIKDKYGCTLYYLGDLYFKKNDYKLALDNYRKSLSIFDSYSISDLLNEDLNYNLTSYAFTTIREDKAYALYSIARCFIQLGKLDSASHYLNMSQEIVKKTNFDRLQSRIYYSYSRLKLAQADTIVALDYIAKSLDGTLNNNLNEFTIYNYLNLMEVNLAQRNYSNIDNIYSKLIALTRKMNMLSENAQTHQLYSEYLFAIGKSTEAYKELEEANQIRLRLFDEDKSRVFGQLEAGIKYQQSLYDMELESIKAKEEEKWLTTQLYFTLAVAILLILIAALILIYASKNKQLSTRLALTNEELELANTKLTELNDTKTKLFRIISHDLRNPIKEFDRGVSHLLNNPNLTDTTQNTTYLKALGDSASNIYGLLNSLLQWAESQFKDTAIKKSEVEIGKVIARTTSLFKSQIDEKNFQIITNLQVATLHTDPNILQIIVQNLIHNSIKFTPDGGTITITSTNEDDFSILEVADSGQGMPQEQIEAILKTTHYNINYDDVQTGSGLGLRAVKDYIDQLEGNLFIESTPNIGTTITIYFS
jgi:signal transduction histidine kinase